MNHLKRRFVAVTSAMRAGWIASNCERQGDGCIIDDDTESIWTCPIHESEITRLGKINKKAQDSPF